MFARYLVSQVKQNGYFCGGVLAGLSLALVLVPQPETGWCPAPLAPEPSPLLEPSPAPLEEAPPPPHDARDQAAPTRPRYYTAELGMREPLMCAVMTSVRELAADGRAAAINATARAAGVPIKYFVSAASASPPPAPDVVVFTDARRTLAPFHVLKYLADNHLDDYDQFLLIEDAAYLDARAALDAARRLGRADAYAGRRDPADPALCSLRSGATLSNSVLGRVRGALDWCVRNAYSAHHHENVGRCVRHAADLTCREHDAGAFPADDAEGIRRAHLLAARTRLEDARDRVWALREEAARLLERHPPGFRNGTWPGGLRGDAGMAPPPPADRHDHQRWTWFNESLVLLWEERAEATALGGAWRDSVGAALEAARALPGLADATLLSGLWRWEPARALRFMLTLRDERGRVRVAEVSRVLGAARLLAEPYVTEAAPLTVLLPATLRDAGDAADVRRALADYATADPRRTTDLLLALSCVNETLLREVRGAVSGMRHAVRVAVHAGCGGGWAARWERGRAALGARARLVLTVHAGVSYGEDLLNRARMNTLRGRQWYRPMPLQRALVSRAGHSDARFSAAHARVWCAHSADLPAPPATLPPRGVLRVLHAPDPALTLHVPRACLQGRAEECAREDPYMGERGALGALVLEERPDIQ